MSDESPKILIVANDDLVLQFAIAACRRLGYVAIGFTDAESALNAAKTTPSLQTGQRTALGLRLARRST